MAKVYKVWIMIEEYDTDTESGEDLGPIDFGCSGTFDDSDEAHECAEALHAHAQKIVTNGTWTP